MKSEKEVDKHGDQKKRLKVILSQNTRTYETENHQKQS